MAEKITMSPEGVLQVPQEPIIPFIEGDGTGVDIWPAAKLVLDAAAAKHGHKVAWKEVLAGEKAFNETGSWLPDETVEAFRDHLIGIKGPLTTPVGGG
ncbi:MAG TPA: isocitrate/isopropylmalate family dehydrogenase, partial [Acidimicrobiales bacterium]|nr:isocitrate/isopropylmalate family dehydrogenase [Acidimicrobiales bacterium]